MIKWSTNKILIKKRFTRRKLPLYWVVSTFQFLINIRSQYPFNSIDFLKETKITVLVSLVPHRNTLYRETHFQTERHAHSDIFQFSEADELSGFRVYHHFMYAVNTGSCRFCRWGEKSGFNQKCFYKNFSYKLPPPKKKTPQTNQKRTWVST